MSFDNLKFIKYYKKYQSLLNQIGGYRCDNNIYLGNVLGTCWNASILMMFVFSKKTEKIFEEKIHFNKEELDKYIEQIPEDMLHCFPFYADDKKDKLDRLLRQIVKRVNGKITDFSTTVRPMLRRQESRICEKDLNLDFFNLVNILPTGTQIQPMFGANIYIQFLYVLLISVLFCNILPEFTTYTIKATETLDYGNQLNCNYKYGLVDIDEINKAIGILISLVGHVTCLYTCSDGVKKHYDSGDSNKVINFNYVLFFEKYNEYINTSIDFNIYLQKKDITINGNIIKNSGLIILNKTEKKLFYLNPISDVGYIEYNITDAEIINYFNNNYIRKYKGFTIVKQSEISEISEESYINKYIGYYFFYYDMNKITIDSKYTELYHEYIDSINVFDTSLLESIIVLDNVETLAYLLDKELYNINKIINGLSLFNIALLVNSPKSVKFLLDKDAIIDTDKLWLNKLIEYVITSTDNTLLDKLIHMGLPLDIQHGLTYAVGQNNNEMIYFLLNNGADITKINNDDLGRLIDNSIKTKDTRLLERVFSVIDINMRFITKNYSALIYAVRQNNNEMVEFLLNKGAEIKRLDDIYFLNILIENAIKNNNTNILLRIFKNTDINYKFTTDMRTSLTYAVKENNFEIVRFLVENGANVNITDTSGSTALIYAVKNKNFEIVIYLVDNGVNADIGDNYGFTALIYAVKNNNLTIVRYLVESGASVNMCDNYGVTALMHAVVENNIDIVTLLLNAFADVDMHDNNGFTALIHAVNENNIVIVKLLLDKGVDINIKDYVSRSTALMHALKYNYVDIINLFVHTYKN